MNLPIFGRRSRLHASEGAFGFSDLPARIIYEDKVKPGASLKLDFLGDGTLSQIDFKEESND
jgi:hypothetical protein